MAFDWRKTPGYLADFGFVVGFFLISIFLVFGAYNPLGEGIVVFKNIDSEVSNATSGSNNFQGLQRNFYVGFDRICMPETLNPENHPITPGHYGTKCLEYKAAEYGHDKMTYIIWFTWLLWTFALVHWLIKRSAVSEMIRPLFNRTDTASKGIYAALFWAPVAFSIVSLVFWLEYVADQDVVPRTGGGHENDVIEGASNSTAESINNHLNRYKDNEKMTWPVWSLLIGVGVQGLGCLVAIFRGVFSTGGTFMDIFQVEIFPASMAETAFTNVGATVDAAAKNPQTKKNAVTSVYANRRVTNGISF